jgi:hypothetical protein
MLSIMQTKKPDRALFEQEEQKTQQVLQTPHGARLAIHHISVIQLTHMKKGATNRTLPSKNNQEEIVTKVNQSKKEKRT